MQLGDFWPGNHVPEKSFANHVEKLAGDILHACELQWYYEPTTFPLEMDEQGKMKKGFAPDFYLPQIKAYFEVTYARSMSGKNRKLRMMEEKHPHVIVFLGVFRDDVMYVSRGYSGEYGTLGSKKFELPVRGDPRELKKYLLEQTGERQQIAA